jgi:non-specific serine/threonine protein kinase
MGSTLAWFAEVELELDNCRAALDWALTQGNDVVVGGAIAGALELLWFRGGLSTEGRYWIGLALKRLDEAEHPQVVARMLRSLATLNSAKASVEASQRAVRLYESVGDNLGAARARISLGFGLHQMGQSDEAMRETQQALVTLRERGNKYDVAWCLGRQGAFAWAKGDLSAGRGLLAQALAATKALGDELSTGIVLGNLAELEFGDGHQQEALRLVNECLELEMRSRRGIDTENLATYHGNGAAYRIAMGDLDGAITSARDALNYSRQAQAPHTLAYALQHIALVIALRGDVNSAARLAAYSDAQLKELGWSREPTEKQGYDKLMATLRKQLSEAEIEKLAAEGAAWSEDQAVEEALKF